jgi:WD40 repeat protein
MAIRTRIIPLVFGMFLASVLIGAAAGISLGTDWKQTPVLADNTFSGVTLTPDGSKVFSGGSQLVVRSWDGSTQWGGQAGFVAAMSPDGYYVVTSSGNTVTLLNVSGTQLWSRNMDGQVRAVAVAPNATVVISADDKGNYNSWTANGEFSGRNQSDLVRRLVFSPAGDIVVATTERGIRFYSPGLEPVWTDSRPGSIDDLIVISSDGSTIITAGGSRVSSHTSNGLLNWQADTGTAAINDIACNGDCSLIVVASQDNSVQGLDRYGKTHWKFSTGQWANAVGTSFSGSVVAAGANDGTLFILDHGGNLLTKQKLSGRIQPRSIGVSRDGSRIAVADQYNLYGMSLVGVSAGSTGSDTVFVAAPLNPVTKTPTMIATVVTILPEETVVAAEETEAGPVATTTKSPGSAGLVAAGIVVAVCLFWIRKR